MKKTSVLILVGLFFGFLGAEAFAARPFLNPGSAVPSADKCDGVLSFENVQVGPESVWAPTDREVMIELTGNIVVPPGCEVKGFYSMESNNGPVAGSLDIEAGSFTRQFPVMVSKAGKGKEGTTYQGTLSIEDEAGNKASQGFLVTVDHDRGKNGERGPDNK